MCMHVVSLMMQLMSMIDGSPLLVWHVEGHNVVDQVVVACDD